MKRYTLLKQVVHDVTNTLSCLLFETDNPLVMECVYQLRLFHTIEDNVENKAIIEFEKTYETEINHFKKEYGISIHFEATIDTMKNILVFLILNRKSCVLTVFDNELKCENNQHFDHKIFETDNGILNYINFHKKFTVKENSNGFSVLFNKI